MIEFIRYVHFSDGTVAAEFRQEPRLDREPPMRLNRESLARRIATLERDGRDASIEKAALVAFPAPLATGGAE